MSIGYKDIFSEFEINRLGIKFEGEQEFTAANCVATFKEEMEQKIITKKCRGAIAKTRTKGTGYGTVEATLHIPYPILVKLKGMEDDALADGVFSYGQKSRHKEFTLVCKIEDEDGNIKLKAYPKCIIQNGIPNEIENESTEVKEAELTISVMPDEYGQGVYETPLHLGDYGADAYIENWLTNWDRAMLASNATLYTLTWSLTKCKASVAPTKVVSGSRLITTITPETGYELPSSITVSGSSNYLWNEDTGLLVIDNITANTSITITATAEE